MLVSFYSTCLSKENEKRLILEGANILQGTTLEDHMRSRSRSIYAIAD
jgi:hypothetical protein